MTDVLKLGKKAFTWSVIVLTILWSMGVSALIPLAAEAATCPALNAGDLFKVSGNSAVYLLNANKNRLYFPHGNVYKSWYKDFSGVQTIDSTCVDAYPAPSSLPIGVNFRPGSKLVKVVISPTVYLVQPGNKVAKLASEDVAKALYGNNWAREVIDVADAFWANYVNKGSDITEAVPQPGMLVKTSGSSDVYYVKDDGKTYKVEGAVLNASEVRVVSTDVFAKAAAGGSSVTSASVVANPSQGSATPTPTGTATPTPTGVPGQLTVSLAPDQPTNTYAVKSAARVPFTKINFTAGSDADVTIDSMVLERTGAPAINADFSTVNVINPKGDLLNDAGKALNADNLATFTEDIVVPKGTTVTYTLVGDMASGLAGGNVPTLTLKSLTPANTATKVVGVPVAGNIVTTNASVTLGTVTLAEGSQVGTITKQVGTANVNLANLKITVATNDFQVERIVLYNAGTTGETDLKNVKLSYNNNSVATGVAAGKYITFDLAGCTDNCKILKGNDKTYAVYADLGGGSSRTVNLDVQRTVHVLAKDLKNSYYVTPTNNADAMTNTVTVGAGLIDVSKTNDVPTGNVPGNATNLSLGSFNFKVTGEAIDIRTLVFKVTTTGTVQPTGLDSLSLVDKNGKVLTSGQDAANVTTAVGYATSTDTFTLQPGDNILTVKGKVDSTALANDTIVIGIDMAGTVNFDARGTQSANTINTGSGNGATPASVVSANTLTVKTGALRVTTSATPPATTFAPGTNGIVFAKVQFDASGSSEDMKVSQFKIKDTTDGTAKTVNIQNITLFVDKDGDSYNNAGTDVALSNTQSGTDSGAGNDETFTFNLSGDDQFVIKAGKVLIVTVKANIAGGAATGTHTLATAVANDVTATGVTTNTQVAEVIDSAAGQAMTVGTAGGTVQVSFDSTSPSSKNYLAGTQGVTLEVFNFLATTTEDVEIDSINLTQNSTVTATAAFQDYTLLYLVDSAGAIVGSATPSSTKVFIDLNPGAFIIRTNNTSGHLLTLKGNLSSIGSGQSVTVGGHRLGHNIAQTAHVVAKGSGSGSTSVVYFGGNSPVSTNTHYMYRTTISVTVLPVTNKLAGSATLFEFDVKNDGTSNAGLYKVSFDIATSTASVTSVSLSSFDVSSAGVLSNEITLYTSSTAGPSYRYDRVIFDSNSDGTSQGGEEVVIAAGLTKRFRLRGTMTGVASGATVTTQLMGDSALPTIAPFANILMASSTAVDSGAFADFIWSDAHLGSHGTSTNDWINGFLVTGLLAASSSPTTLSP